MTQVGTSSSAQARPGIQVPPPARGLSAERTELVLAHLGLADALARRYRRANSDWSDLQQIARLGLLHAALRYDPGFERAFAVFAVPTICGEIKRHLRDHGWAVRPPRRVQELRASLFRLTPELTQQLGRVPSCAELAHALTVKTKDVEEALLSENSITPQSLDAQNAAYGSSWADRWGQAEDVFSRIDELLSLRCALRDLTPWERQLLALRFQEDLSQQQIAAVLDISQMQVSRALAALLAKLRAQLGAD